MIINSPDWGPKMPPAAGPEEGGFQPISSCIPLFLSFVLSSVWSFPKTKIRLLPIWISGALLGMPARVEGSAMTLIPNSSTTDVADEREFHHSVNLYLIVELEFLNW